MVFVMATIFAIFFFLADQIISWLLQLVLSLSL
jgi:preprotein translocase subunit SecE